MAIHYAKISEPLISKSLDSLFKRLAQYLPESVFQSAVNIISTYITEKVEVLMILKVTLTPSNTFPINPDKECLAQLNIWYLSTMHVMQQTFHQAHQQKIQSSQQIKLPADAEDCFVS